MDIRPAHGSDAQSITELWNTYIRDTLWTFTTAEKTVEQMSDLIDNGFGTFVAYKGDLIAGFATYSQFRNGPGYANTMEHTIVVGEAHTGQNIGRLLLDVLEEDARTKGFHSMIGGISSANPRGEAFHAAVGYAHVGTVKEAGFKEGQWLDLILMQKIL